MQGARGHGDDELGRREGEREGFAGQGDGGGEVGGRGGVVDVQGRVPGGGDEDVRFLAVGDGFDAGVVGGEDGLLAGCEVDSAGRTLGFVLVSVGDL